MKFYYANNIGDEGYFKEDNLLMALFMAWNIESRLYIKNIKGEYSLIFNPLESNEFNNELLKGYGYKIENIGGYREIVNIKTGRIEKVNWKHVRDL